MAGVGLAPPPQLGISSEEARGARLTGGRGRPPRTQQSDIEPARPAASAGAGGVGVEEVRLDVGPGVGGRAVREIEDDSVEENVGYESEGEGGVEGRGRSEREVADLEHNQILAGNEDYARFKKGRKAAMDDTHPMDRLRLWETALEITGIQNVTNSKQDVFYVVTLRHVNKKKRRGVIRRTFMYTDAYYLEKGANKRLRVPEKVSIPRTLKLSYNDLKDYCVTFDMWKLNNFTFNTHHASAQLSLYDAASESMDRVILVKRTVKKGHKTNSFEVQRLSITCELSEVFSFELKFDNWGFRPNDSLDKALIDAPKRLEFAVPKNKGGKFRVRSTKFDKTSFWKQIPTFHFKGTKSHLENTYFAVKVFAFLSHLKPTQYIGKAILSLKSVLDISVFKGDVKILTSAPDKLRKGMVRGNVKCQPRSAFATADEDDNVKVRPEQPRGAALLSQLDIREQYLVVRISKCENLPVADSDTGSSDPFVRVKWDGLIQNSPVRERTTRPVFNQNFYFPVRLISKRSRTNPKYIRSALPVEMFSKGSIDIEVWDNDDFSSDFLGGCRVDLADITGSNNIQKRSLAYGTKKKERRAGPDAVTADDEDDIEDEDGGKRRRKEPWDVELDTRVVEGYKEPLIGSQIKTVGTSSIFFECYFWPDFHESLRIEKPKTEESREDAIRKAIDTWNADFTAFQNEYLQDFPDGPKDRTWTCAAEHPQTKQMYPLPCFVTPIVIPEEMAAASKLLHWMQCLSFVVGGRQEKEGKIKRWYNSSFLLARRQGAVQDHALLLCGLLLGTKKDAYVCKGTLPYGDEHVWVMTREEGPSGYVTFWELTQRMRYYLPLRWAGRPETFDTEESAIQRPRSFEHRGSLDSPSSDFDSMWADTEVKDQTVREDEYDSLPHMSNIPRPKRTTAKVAPRKKSRVSREAQQREHAQRRAQKPYAPQMDLVRVDDTLVPVPYETIEVVFNHERVFGNLQNHHPACIKYDFENPQQWRDLNQLLSHQDYPERIDADVTPGPALRPHTCEREAAKLVGELCENIRMYRARLGLETLFDNSEPLTDKIRDYLDLLEQRHNLSPEFDPGPGEPTGFSNPRDETEAVRVFKRYPPPDSISPTPAEVQSKWHDYYDREKKLYESGREALQVRKGHQFSGFPMHFCSADSEKIREYLLQMKKFRAVLEAPLDSVVYTIVCRIFGLSSSIPSVWIFFGASVAVVQNQYTGEKTMAML
ncbi:unnamed protein product [Vitrella brassicaformis CCMP3155]|uniref:C2 domain-containing protein n=1 Tax=Vitrella brassicaformis (strain CCMP3155) TaxID=1169540 RepID=A0A0G4H5F8_VITBC|nr:unnamed protein product [Vitrella brassicaformis CCMP3155]|eukprot:CEM39026.1 unnamed protein product [Vitrella brassicaformis CCMP3155]